MTTPIDQLPPRPDRNDMATFEARTEALLEALDPWAVQVQAVGNEAEAAAEAAATNAVNAVTDFIAGWPVASVNGRTGVVTGVQDSLVSGTNIKTINGSSVLGSGDIAITGNATHTGDAVGATSLTVVRINGTLLSGLATGLLKNTTGTGTPSIATPGTDYVAPTGSDGQLARHMLLDCGLTVLDKGNSGTSTQTYDYTAGSVQTSTATGNHTIATSNWPPTGNLGQILIQLTNGGAYTITWPTINWIKPDGTTTTNISTYLAANTGRTALQSSGMDQILLWTRNAGTTIYGKLV